MRLYFNLSAILIVFISTSCQQDNWTEDEKKSFVDDCMKEGGGKVYCKCFMEKAMLEFPIAEDAQNMEFEEAVELSKDCK